MIGFMNKMEGGMVISLYKNIDIPITNNDKRLWRDCKMIIDNSDGIVSFESKEIIIYKEKYIAIPMTLEMTLIKLSITRISTLIRLYILPKESDFIIRIVYGPIKKQ